jgi:methyl-accepting chemotaxis protein
LREITSMPNATEATILMVFVALTAIALLVQAIILVAVFFAGKKAFDSLRGEFEELRTSALPVLNISRQFFERLGPDIGPVTSDVIKTAANLKTITSDMAELTTKVRTQVEDVQTSANEALERIKQQAARVDIMVTNLLDAADRVTGFLENAVSVPVRQFAGVLAAVKAIVETLRHAEPPTRRVQPNNDHESFI